MRFILPPAKNAIDRLSGDQITDVAPSVLGDRPRVDAPTTAGARCAARRSRRSPTNASCEPSGEIASGSVLEIVAESAAWRRRHGRSGSTATRPAARAAGRSDASPARRPRATPRRPTAASVSDASPRVGGAPTTATRIALAGDRRRAAVARRAPICHRSLGIVRQAARTTIETVETHRRGRRRSPCDVGAAPKRRASGRHLIQHGAERVDVAARVGRPALDLFRRHVLHRAERRRPRAVTVAPA